jgi:hypothetical protein
MRCFQGGNLVGMTRSQSAGRERPYSYSATYQNSSSSSMDSTTAGTTRSSTIQSSTSVITEVWADSLKRLFCYNNTSQNTSTTPFLTPSTSYLYLLLVIFPNINSPFILITPIYEHLSIHILPPRHSYLSLPIIPQSYRAFSAQLICR